MTKTKKKVEEVEVIVPNPEPTEKDKKEIAVVSKIIEDKSIAPHQAFGKLTRGQIELIKRTVAKGATDDELKLFIQVCAGARLNPFLRQAHLRFNYNHFPTPHGPMPRTQVLVGCASEPPAELPMTRPPNPWLGIQPLLAHFPYLASLCGIVPSSF